jgi:hypothetical protein
MARRPLVIVMDVEPDERKPQTSTGGWSGVLDTIPRFEDMRRRFAEKTGAPVRFNWYLRMDPQIEQVWGDPRWIAQAAPQLFETAEKHGDHMGIHPHMWRWDESRRDWYSDIGDVEWMRNCFQTARQAFTDVTGAPPVTCRFGDRYLSEAVVNEMDAAGIQVDVTLEPGLPDEKLFEDPLATGLLPDCRTAPRIPYQPESGNYLRTARDGGAARKLWMLPMSTTPPYWRWIRRRPGIGRFSQSPSLVLAPRRIGMHLAREISRGGSAPLVFTVRGGDLSNGDMLQHFTENVRLIEQAPGLDRCEFTTPQAAVAQWR